MDITPAERKLKQIERYVEYRVPYSSSDTSTAYSKGYADGVNYVKDKLAEILRRKYKTSATRYSVNITPTKSLHNGIQGNNYSYA